MIPFQIGEALGLAVAVSKFFPLRYLALSSLTQGLSDFMQILQPNLEIKALLRSKACLKSRPPIDLGMQREPQALG